MQILAVDIGTGTQDILLFDARLDAENSFKLVLPSPTMMVRRKIESATQRNVPIALHGVTMGGGPCSWAIEGHLKAGLQVFATPNAARTLNDDLSAVQEKGIQIIDESELPRLSRAAERIEMRDFDYSAIRRAFAEFGVSLDDLSAVAVAVFDHGAAPPEISDRQFRFDYLDERIRAENRLSAFAFPAERIPPIMTRLQAVADSAGLLPAPLIVMDTAPAAILGAALDPFVAAQPQAVIANVGNFHTLAFRLGPGGIEGVFEHHTGLLDRPALEQLLRWLAAGTLTHAEVFNHHGHGALLYQQHSLHLGLQDTPLVVTGPRRSLLRGSSLQPYFASPYGDMMIAGCFGLVSAVADHLPHLREPIQQALRSSRDIAPWDVA